MTFDFYGSSPIHRALKKLEPVSSKETEEDLMIIRTAQILSAKFIVDKIFSNEKKFDSEKRTINEQHLIRELLPYFLECIDKPFPFESISRFFEYFDVKDDEQKLNSNFATYNDNEELPKYQNKKSYTVQIEPDFPYLSNQEDRFYDQMLKI